MRKSPLLIGLSAAGVLLSLACGGSPTDVSDLSIDIPETPAVAGTEISGDFASWKLPDDLESKLKALGYTVDECSLYSEDGETYAECEAHKGETWVLAELNEWGSTTDAMYMAEDNPMAARDGKRVLETTIFNGDAASEAGKALCPKGTKIHTLKADAVAEQLKGMGWTIDETSQEQDPEMVYGEVFAEKDGATLLVEWSYQRGSTGGSEYIRELTGGVMLIGQGDEDVFTLSVLDSKASVALLKKMK